MLTEERTLRLFDHTRLEPGMMTAAPIFGRDRLLLGARQRLTRETIERLPIWGIYHVFILNEEEEEETSVAA